jgi:hypothetical protein
VAAAPRIDLHPRNPWGLQFFDRTPLSPIWVGAVIGLGVFAVFLLYTAAFCEGVGRLGASVVVGRWGFLAELIQDLFIGFTLAVSAASVRGARRDLEALLPHLETSGEDRASLDRQIFRYQRAPLFAAGLFFGVFSALLTVTDESLWMNGRPGWTHPALLWLAARNFLNWWFVGRAMVLELMLGRAFSRLGDRLARFDVLDRNPLAPFGSRALRNVLLWMLLAAFLSLSYLGEGWASDMMWVALAGLGAFALTAFLLPLMGAHRRLRTLKQEELARVRVAIADARDETLGPGPHPGGGRLADLLGYESRVQTVAEWPIDAGTLLRLALYMAIGLGSWLGAAVVERALDTVLG